MTPALKRYCAFVADMASKLHPKSLAAKLRRLNTTLVYVDTETTGLKDYRDQIHELAMIATNKSFQEIGKLHLKLELSSRNPKVLLDKGLENMTKALDLITTYQLKDLCADLERRCALIRDEKAQHTETAYYEILYNTFTRILGENKLNDYQTRSLYWGLYFIIEAYKIKYVLDLTEYDDKDTLRFSQEEEIGKSYRGFIDKVARTTNIKEPVMVAQNFDFDQKMVYAATRKAGVRFKCYRFIDTVYVTKKFVSRHMLCTFKYFYEKWKLKKSVRLAKILVKLKPLPRNKLGIVTEFFGISNPNWHTALNDTRVLPILLNVQLAIDARFHAAAWRKPALKKIEDDFLEQFNLTLKGTPRDFLHGPADVYRKEHTRLYCEFLGQIGEEPDDHLKKIYDYDSGKDREFFAKIKEEFPSLGFQEEYKPERFKLKTNWKKRNVF